MATKQTIKITEIKCRPYCQGDMLACNPIETYCINSQRHFILKEHMSHLAVKILVENLDAFNERSRPSRDSFRVTLVHFDSDSALNSRTVAVEVANDDFNAIVRVDLPVRAKEILPNEIYELRIARNREPNNLLMVKQLMFVKSTLPPTKFYAPERAFVLHDDVEGEEQEYIFCAYPSPAGFKVGFDLSVMDPQFLIYPELIAKLWVEGVDYDATCEIRSLHEKDADGHWMVRATVDIDEPLSSWSTDSPHTCYCELLSMGYPFAGFAFKLFDDTLEGYVDSNFINVIPDYNSNKGLEAIEALQRHMKEAAERIESAEPPKPIDKLNAMIGLTNVKAQVKSYSNLVKFFKQRSDKGLKVKRPPLHSMFLGSPGTGKTTVARILGEILHECGVLSKGHVVMTERSKLVGKYYGTEEENVRAAIEEAKGGILFIDEAYQLAPNDPKDPGRFVIDSLMTALADDSNRDWMLILAGYDEPMQRLFKLNPGLRSRFPGSNIFKFKDYTKDELLEIATSYIEGNDYSLTHNAQLALERRIAFDYDHRDSEFGNARCVMNLIETGIIPAMAARVAEMEAPSVKDLVTIKSADIPAGTNIVRMQPLQRRIGFVS